MERTLTNFVRALRSADVPVSPVESIEAAKALKLIGYSDRESAKAFACVCARKIRESKKTFTTACSTSSFQGRTARSRRLLKQPSQRSDEQDQGCRTKTRSNHRSNKLADHLARVARRWAADPVRVSPTFAGALSIWRPGANRNGTGTRR